MDSYIHCKQYIYRPFISIRLSQCVYLDQSVYVNPALSSAQLMIMVWTSLNTFSI